MDNCVPDWNTEFGAEFSLPVEKKPLGLENELMELLWQNGDVVLHNQTSIKQSKQVQPIQDYETISWIDESFEKEFYTNHFSEIPPSNTIEPNKPLEKYDNGKAIKFDTTANSDQNTESIVKNDNNFRLPVKKHEISHVDQGPITECSVKTVNLSHCASNQVVSDIDMHWASSSYGIGGKTVVSGVEVKYGRNASPGCESTDKETLGYGSSFWNQSNETNSHKRKSRDVEESECRSDASELDSGGGSGNKLSQKSGTTRSSRLAEVHNLSERKRRDRINERMKALQELIPHSNKSDKASMLDEAIEYMKSLQWQIQLMWMGGGMAPMMLPGMQPMLPSVQNLMHLSRSPLVDRAVNQEPVGHRSLVNYQNQMQNPSFPEQHANYMGFHTVPSTLQPVNMFDFGFHSAQQNQILQPPDNGNGSIG